MKPEYLVIGLATTDVIIAVFYGISKDYARVAYWLSAAGITFSTLWMK